MTDKQMIQKIKVLVARGYDLPVQVMQRKRRLPERKAECRMVAAFLSDKNTGYSRVDLGHFFNRDHSTITHAVHVIKDRMSVNIPLRIRIDSFQRTIDQWRMREAA